MSKCLAAYTKPGSQYPGYINYTLETDGSITIHLRGDPTVTKGVYICGYAVNRNEPGRCTPGDGNCNNYCNLAPEKGLMQPSPKPCDHVIEGPAAMLRLSADEFRSFTEDTEKRIGP